MRTPLPRNRFERPSVDPGPSGGPDPFSLADPPAVKQILQAAGFADVAFTDVHEPVYYGPDLAAALAWVCGFACTSEILKRLDRRRGARGRARARGARRAPERRRRSVRLPRLDHHRPSPLKLRTEHNRAQPDEQSETASTIARPDP